jgi:type I restriction enzyme S subunit
MSISTEAFFDMPIPVPSDEEQQRIVACLGSLNTLITAASRKLDALRVHKKGLMQQLFPPPDGM